MSFASDPIAIFEIEKEVLQEIKDNSDNYADNENPPKCVILNHSTIFGIGVKKIRKLKAAAVARRD